MRSEHNALPATFATAALGLVAASAWVVVGDALPGGRWFAVHLFTLAVLSPLVLVLSQHFGATLTRSREGRTDHLAVLFGGGALLVLVAVPTGSLAALATGATVASCAVLVGYLRLRRHRRSALGARFDWIVRLYERAHGAFLHGAVLGALLGTGVLAGRWYWPGRVAHLHANVLGWGGLTLLATLVFFGPTVLRRQIEPGADERAARALRIGATGLSVAVLALLATGVGGVGGTAMRLLAAAGLAALAGAAAVVCLPVIRIALRGSPAGGRWPIAFACGWFLVGLLGDVVVVATGSWAWLDQLGAVLLLGVLLQAIQAATMHLLPIQVGRDRAHRDALRDAVDHRVAARTLAGNLGVLLVVFSASMGPASAATVRSATARTGWALVVAAALQLVWSSSRAALRTSAVSDPG